MKYTRKWDVTSISVPGAVEGERVVHRVKDYGTSFDMVHAKKLFGVFERLHTDADFEGTESGSCARPANRLPSRRPRVGRSNGRRRRYVSVSFPNITSTGAL